ncbi:MAG: HAMP domain-containing sensor histidine kinase [Candidatus Izemoplasma sp.]|nr:HAMP domain-containing sensor histidine kinase [Candidatus Izemoplasma sp.]
MNKSLKQKFKRNIFILTFVVTVIFIVINLALYVINNNYLINKIEEENDAFLGLTTHLINENDINIAMEYVEHYTHIHEVDVEVMDEDGNMVFSSNVAHLYSSRYTIETMKGDFTVFIDNTDSVTVNTVQDNTIYINVSLLVIYIIALGILIYMNNKNARMIQDDVDTVLDLMDRNQEQIKTLHHDEFSEIYHTIINYIENIDLLTAQKEMNIKGIAHDIKTPLTITYAFFEKLKKGKKLTNSEIDLAFESSQKINHLLNDIIEDNERKSFKSINISRIIQAKQREYQSVFDNKQMTIITNLDKNVKVTWSEKDFSRVIDNIISNAYYYSKLNSDLIITLKQEEKTIIEFISTPKNIDILDLSKVFKQGYRGDRSQEENGYGKGYGLYLSRVLLNTIGGKITAKVEKQNVKFTIML